MLNEIKRHVSGSMWVIPVIMSNIIIIFIATHSMSTCGLFYLVKNRLLAFYYTLYIIMYYLWAFCLK